MRNGKGCQSCRSRHVKCVTEPGATVCTRCKEADRPCVFDSKFRFREVRHVDTASQGVRSRTHLVYEDDQLWVPTREAVGFVLEDGAGAEYGTADFIEQDERLERAQDTRRPSTAGPSFHERTDPAPGHSAQTAIRDATQPEGVEQPMEIEASPRPPHHSPATVTWRQYPDQLPINESQAPETERPLTRASAVVENHTSPATLSELSRRHEGGRRLTWSTGEYGFLVGDSIQASPAGNVARTPVSTVTIDLSHREALLVQHFIQKLAPWLDCCDCTCKFAQEVPKRAVHTPMVLYAVLALSSRHKSLMAGNDELEASYYHGQCLELVINALSQPESSYNDNLFATIVCLRVYEELYEEADDFLHLQGVGRLLNAIPTFAHSGGLAEAASWQALRQDVYVSLCNKVPPSFDLENYGRSHVMEFQDDDACANAVILLFARLLRQLYSPVSGTSVDSWSDIDRDVVEWDAQRPLIFQPLFAKDADPGQDQPFPVIRLSNPAQVVALQYYYACIVLLRQHKPPDLSLSGFEAAKGRKTAERELVSSLLSIIGLAESNSWVENANFTAHHMLRSSGYHISNPIQREHSISFLRHVQTVMGYKTQQTIDLLRGQWQDLDESAE